jgi:hypothetical protein
MTEIAHEKGGFKNPILAFCLDKPALLNFDNGGCHMGKGTILSALSMRLCCFTVTYWQGGGWRPFLKINRISTKTGLAAT